MLSCCSRKKPVPAASFPSVQVVLEHDFLGPQFTQKYAENRRIKFLQLRASLSPPELYETFLKPGGALYISPSSAALESFRDAMETDNREKLVAALKKISDECLDDIDILELVMQFMYVNSEAASLLSNPDMFLMDKLVRPEYILFLNDVPELTPAQVRLAHFASALQEARTGDNKEERLRYTFMQFNQEVEVLPYAIKRGLNKGDIAAVVETRLMLLQTLIRVNPMVVLARQLL